MPPTDPPARYRVVYSALVERQLEGLAGEAIAARRRRGLRLPPCGVQATARALREFGDPLIDLTARPGIIYNGIIPPISMRYGIFDDRRLVLLAAPPVLLPMERTEAQGDG